MAFSYRSPQSPPDSVPFPGYSNNPLSPPRTTNRRSVGGMLGTASTTTSNETRAGLTRRFTTNGLPTLSPIGQQRRMAAGDTMQVSDTNFKSAREDQRGSEIKAFRYWKGR